MHSNNSATCRKCHEAASNPSGQRGASGRVKLTCIDCHINIVHAPVVLANNLASGWEMLARENGCNRQCSRRKAVSVNAMVRNSAMRNAKQIGVIVSRAALTLMAILIASAMITVTSRQAMATPKMAQATGQPCTKCHEAPPALNDYGQKYKESLKK